MSDEIRKSNDYYMNVGIQKTEIPKKKRSPFGILAILLFFIGLGISLGLNYIYVGVGLEVLAFIFAIIHKIIKKKGLGKIFLTFFGVLLSVAIVLLPTFINGIYDLSNPQPIALQILNNLTQKPQPEEPETETEPIIEETETETEDLDMVFDINKDYITNSNWQVLDDNSCFYFLDSGNYYWCKEKNNFDDNYYYGNYTVYQGQEAMDKLAELEYNGDAILQASMETNMTEPGLEETEESTEPEATGMASIHKLDETMVESESSEDIEESSEEIFEEETSETEIGETTGIEQVYFIEMTNDLCYMEGEDISIEYKETKPVRYYCIVVTSPYLARGCDLDSLEEGFIDLSKIAETDITAIDNKESSVESSEETMEETFEEETSEIKIETEN